MNQDPIVEEVHRTRQKILAECDGDLDQLLNRLKATEVQNCGPALISSSVAKEACVMRSREANSPLSDSACG